MSSKDYFLFENGWLCRITIDRKVWRKNDSIIYVGTSEGALYSFNLFTKKNIFFNQITDQFINDIYIINQSGNLSIIADNELFYGNVESGIIKSVLKTDFIMSSLIDEKENNLYLALNGGVSFPEIRPFKNRI